MKNRIIAGIVAGVVCFTLTAANVFAAEQSPISEEITMIENFPKGDVDSSTEVNLGDLDTLAVAIYPNCGLAEKFESPTIEINEEAADMNNDGNIDCFDIILLANYLVATRGGTDISVGDFDYDNMATITEKSYFEIFTDVSKLAKYDEKYRDVVGFAIVDFFNNYTIMNKSAITTEITTTEVITTEATITTTITTTPEKDFLLGDVNNDGVVDAKDAAVILNDYATALLEDREIENEVADFNKDGRVDSADASAILTYYAEVLLEM